MGFLCESQLQSRKETTMKFEARINILCKTESGTSKATGNAWTSKEAVFEYRNANGCNCSIAAKTKNPDIIARLERMEEGDGVVVDIDFCATARTWKRNDGSETVFRGNEAYILSVEREVRG